MSELTHEQRFELTLWYIARLPFTDPTNPRLLRKVYNNIEDLIRELIELEVI
jgi:hypothetical protein